MAQRAEFVSRETSDDPALGAELARLLEASDGAPEYVGRLRQDLLGSGMQGLLRAAAAAGDGPDPWIGRKVSHYEILERIGGGGMGVVYRARDARLDRAVALKFIAPEIRSDPQARQRLLDEARAASALDQPNICTIHEIGETEDGRQFIVMPAYDGETLRSRLDRPPLPIQEVLDIAAQISRALAAAHARGIVHRDVKPDNVFITRDGVVKLLDFGLARTAEHRMSGPTGMAGTVTYMSPEQSGGQRADARSDVWALGVILYEMLAGVRPFVAKDPRALLELIVTRDPDFAALHADLDPAIASVVRRALAKDPSRRFAGGGELLDALNGCQRPPAAASAPTRRRPAASREIRLGAFTVGLLIVGSLVVWRFRAGGDPVPELPSIPAGTVAHALWVDDNPENNSAVIRRLADRGIQVTTVLNTAEAIRRFDPAVHQFVISDMGRFEGANNGYVERAGLDLLSRLRARRPDVQLAFCTSARAVRYYRSEAVAAGALGMFEDCAEVIRVMGR